MAKLVEALRGRIRDARARLFKNFGKSISSFYIKLSLNQMPEKTAFANFWTFFTDA